MREATELDKYWVNEGTVFNWSIGIVIASIVLMIIYRELIPCVSVSLILGIISTYIIIKNAPKED